MSPGALLAAADLKLAYGKRLVLEGFSIELAEGDRFALTGRSGSGKTSLLLMLAGLIAPTGGSIERKVPAVYVPQAPSLVPELSARQNAALGLRIRGVAPDAADERAREELRALGLDGVEDALPAELSGGMQQRVALARALAVDPPLLLADEPTGALDRATGARVVDLLLSRDATVVVATHDPEVAARFPRRLTVALDDKELVE
ncbi:ATP-binding cassette domain-containing protein [Actinoplanes bogorensis]|uniref:ATP-binding cassette domain-containing protein n=1 Tax=Paractinoplanes bogorensis TaxID=1610840 RepID=A0ABS5YX14_9ACTN|nr:ATP-binding cassette domain-containing protein [Actinoplanes bogorensis]MBU2667975.1 ATP-binding cassette domain-containing protein [Actinoplanes bogorensis]